MHRAVLLPGGVLPSALAYGALLKALGDRTEALAKDLELYSTDPPPAGYGLDLEAAGVLREADAAGFARFHLVGYSAGGAAAVAFAASHPERVLSLALLEPAWMGNEEQSEDERAVRRRFAQIARLPAEEFMSEFVRSSVAPGVALPAPPAGPQPPWMATRPVGLKTLIDVFEASTLDLDALRALRSPVYLALGDRSNPRFYGRMAERACRLFQDCTLEVFAGRHHFDPPHRAEPARLARRLREMWRRAEREGTG
jgi:pimeloyl-ACP methyl ester carboxylesterase